MTSILSHGPQIAYLATILIIGIILGRIDKNRDSERNFRKWYHRCKYCQHCNIRGVDKRFEYAAFCFHPDNTDHFNSIDRVDLSFYCGKWEPTETFNTELFKYRTEKSFNNAHAGKDIPDAK